VSAAQSVPQAHPGHKVFKATMAPLARRGLQEVTVQMAQQVQLDLLVPQDPSVQLDLLVPQDLQEQMVQQVLLVQRVRQVQTALTTLQLFI
jgi:hypothetical protein